MSVFNTILCILSLWIEDDKCVELEGMGIRQGMNLHFFGMKKEKEMSWYNDLLS